MAKAYINSALASAGPWLFTIIALGSIAMFSGQKTENIVLVEFRSIVIYNFCFSLVMASPIFMIATRYVSDALYRKDCSTIPGVMLGCLALFIAVGLPASALFYFRVASLPVNTVFLAVMNFLLTGMVWLVVVFLSALKDYKSITAAFFIGMLSAAAAAS